MINKRFNIVIVVITFGVFFSFFTAHQGLGTMMVTVRTLHQDWIELAASLIMLSWIFEMLVLYTILKDSQHAKNSLLKAFKFQMVGQFFGAISPFSAGSHPAQLFTMKKNGIPVGEAGSMLMIKFMIHQVVNIIIFTISTLLTYHYFEQKVHYFTYLCGLGLAVHTAVLIFSVLVLINQSLTKRILAACLRMLYRIRLVKNPDVVYQKLNLEVEHFHANAVYLSKKIRVCIYASIFTCLQYAAYFSVPYCIYRSFGLHSAELWSLICAQIFLSNFMAAIPLPGAAGGAEGGFYFIYSLYFPSNTLLTALFVWRLLSYYTAISFSSIFALSWTKSKESATGHQN
ncbi:hypothetical protein SAMN05518847_101104 [Paenibacillus sp. OV219]|nr:lysylphosphatidylglycerol synthase transmembrane domain-containing protein [Paenibacillus sp. OV219]SEM54040.1 hypothetical protein SAMN05518847_101104 [Paenibacillus sp. OV219]